MNRPNKPPGLALALLMALGVAASVPAHAAVTFISPTSGNGGFETPQLTSPGYVYTPTGATWTFDPSGNSGIIKPPSGFGGTAAPQGNQYAFIQAASNLNGYFYQPLTVTGGTTYDYSFQVAGRPGGGDTVDAFGIFTNSGVFIAPPIRTFSTSSADTSFTTYSGTFSTSANGGGTFNIGFINQTQPSASIDETAFVDNVNISAAPEPAQVCTLGFFGLGLLGLALRARRRGLGPV